MIDQTVPQRNLQTDPLALFFFAYRAFTAIPDAELAKRGLQRVHHRVLYFVGANPGIQVNALQEILGVSKQALHGPLRDLQRSNLIRSSTAAHDRRVRELKLTPAGTRLTRDLSAGQLRLMKTAFVRCGSDAEAGWRLVMQSLARTP